MAFVVDASITASWLFPDEEFPEAREAWRRFETENVLVPRHWWFEVRNVLLMGERKGRISEKVMTDSLNRLAILPIITEALPSEMDVLAHARRYRLTFYDAAYLELAQRERVALATLDNALAAAARAEGVTLITD